MTVSEAVAFQLDKVESDRVASGKIWNEFLSVGTLSTGLYVLTAGSDDPQNPHHEDEVYYVVRGRGTLQAGDQEFPVSAGSVLFVARELPHKFHDIAEDLHVLVFFAPAHTYD